MIPVSIALFIRNVSNEGLELWMQVRREEGPLDGLLEFPGGKIESGESSVVACQREVQEEVGVDVELSKLKLFKIHQHNFNDRSVLLNVFMSNYSDLPEDIGQWFSFDFVEKSKKYEGRLPEVNYLLIDQLLSYVERQYKAGCLEQVWLKS